MPLTITNDSVHEANYDTESLQKIKYGNDKVWPLRDLDDLFYSLQFSADERCAVAMTKDDYEYAYVDGEEGWQPFEQDVIEFGGSLGTLCVRKAQDYHTSRLRVYEASDVPWTVKGPLRSVMPVGDPSITGWDATDAFMNCTHLVDASGIEFPTDEVFNVNSFKNMFKGCSMLLHGPSPCCSILPSGACESMFENCTALLDTPELPTSSLSYGCYMYMFRGCTSLVKAADLGAVSYFKEDSCYGMYENCTSLVDVPDLPDAAMGIGSLASMFKDCTALKKAPELPSRWLASGCYANMFDGCRALEDGPSELPASTAPSFCYKEMFRECENLKKQPEMHISDAQEGCCKLMFYGCTSLTEAFIDAVAVNPDTGREKMGTDCFYGMFAKCTRLVDIKTWIVTCSPLAMTDWIAGIQPFDRVGTFTCRRDCNLYQLIDPDVPHDGYNIPYGWTVIR